MESNGLKPGRSWAKSVGSVGTPALGPWAGVASVGSATTKLRAAHWRDGAGRGRPGSTCAKQQRRNGCWLPSATSEGRAALPTPSLARRSLARPGVAGRLPMQVALALALAQSMYEAGESCYRRLLVTTEDGP